MKITDVHAIVAKRDAYMAARSEYKKSLEAEPVVIKFANEFITSANTINRDLMREVAAVVRANLLERAENARAQLMLVGVTEFTPDTEIPSLPGSQA